jgi:GNAT superfamily N-acetyltransferase
MTKADKYTLKMIHPKVRGNVVADVSFKPWAGEISHFYVYPKYRKLGYGKRLLRMMERHAYKDGARYMTVWVAKGTEDFYRHMGYQILTLPDRAFKRAVKKLESVKSGDNSRHSLPKSVRYV